MRHKLSRIMALLVAMAMLVGLMPVGMFAFAEEAVELPAGKFMVDDDWAKMPNNAQVQLTHKGVTYVGRIGQNAFASLPDAAAAAKSGDDVYVAAGVYTTGVSTNKNIGFYGPGADVNPNMPDWSLNPERADLTKEAVIKDCLITFTNKASTKLVVNGFTLTGSAYLNESTSGGANTGIDFSYNRAVDMKHTATPGMIYMTGTTTRSGKISYNRIEDDTRKPLMVRNPVDGFHLFGNYATVEVDKTTNQTSTEIVWVSAEIANQNTTPGKMDVVITDNYFDCTGGNSINANISYAYEAKVYIARNHFVGRDKAVVAIGSAATSTEEKNVTIEDNYFQRTLKGCYHTQMTGSSKYNADLVTIRGNIFESDTGTTGYDVRLEWIGGPLNLQFNHFTSGTPILTIAGEQKPLIYPMYADKEKTTLVGEMQVKSLKLTGVDKITNQPVVYDDVTIDHEAQTVTFNGIIASTLKDVKLVGTYTEGVAVKMYQDSTKTVELVDGALDYLVYGTNYAYINLVTSVDNYSYLDYTVIINREASAEAEILGVKAPMSGTVNNNVVDVTVEPHNFHPNLTLDYSQGAKLKIFKDAARTQPILGTVLTNLAVGKNTYYLTVVAENEKNSTNYTLNVTRPAVTDAEIVEVVSPDYVIYDEAAGAFVGEYPNATTGVALDVTVSERATWGVYSDAAATQPVAADNLTLAVGINVFYVKVSSEANAASKIHKIVLIRTEEADANFLLSSIYPKRAEITDTTVTGKVPYTDTTVTPEFNFEGKAWKLYGSYDAKTGILSDPVAGNTLKNLGGGLHTYYIEVISQNGLSRVYTFYLTREFNTLCAVTDIENADKLYIDRFDHIIQFEVKDEGEFTPELVYSYGATIQWKDAAGTNIDMPMNLLMGQYNYTLVVTAEDGVTKTTYSVLITCIGDTTEALTKGVAYNTAWSTLPAGTKVYPTIQGKTYKAFIGENAFSDIDDAEAAMGAYNSTIFVMSGVTISKTVNIGTAVKLYGPNYLQNPQSDARFEEALITAQVTVSLGADDVGMSEISGFTFSSKGRINSTRNDGMTIKNNIFDDDGTKRTNPTIRIQGTGSTILYTSILVEDNVFDLRCTTMAMLFGCYGDLKVQNNTFTNSESGTNAVFMRLQNVYETATIRNNTFAGDGALGIDTLTSGAKMHGTLKIQDNVFTNLTAIRFAGATTEDTFAMEVSGNTFNTVDTAIAITSGCEAFENALHINKNTFANYTEAITYTGASGDGVVDMTFNYFGRDMLANDLGDEFVCVPYYLDAAMTISSDLVEFKDITVNGKAPVTHGDVTYLMVDGNTATVTATPIYGSLVFNTDGSSVGMADALTITMDGADKKVYIVGVSKDDTNVVVKEIVLLTERVNPILEVSGGVSAEITDTAITVKVRKVATTWEAGFVTADGSAVKLFDAAGKEIAGNVVTLTGATTTVTAKVMGKEIPVKIVKNPSDEKVIYDIPNVYKFEYTATSDIDVYLDSTKATADLTPVVSDGATAKLYEDGFCQNEMDMKAVPTADGNLFMKVTAADGSERIYSLTVIAYDVIYPEILGMDNTEDFKVKGDEISATITTYSTMDGFVLLPQVEDGVKVTFYADAAQEVYVKNDVVFFNSNIVTIYAHVVSPDGKLVEDYQVTLYKPVTTNIKFVDAIPSWAKAAVDYVKDKGIVSGSPVKDGYKLDANGKATREMVASFIVRAIGVDLTQFATTDLSTVFVDGAEVSSWAAQSVSAAVQIGFFSGSAVEGGFAFRPKANITRQEFASAFVRAIGAADEDVSGITLKYKDNAKISNWAVGSVKVMAKLGFMKGDNVGNFNPTANITRAEIIQVIYMYLTSK